MYKISVVLETVCITLCWWSYRKNWTVIPVGCCFRVVELCTSTHVYTYNVYIHVPWSEGEWLGWEDPQPSVSLSLPLSSWPAGCAWNTGKKIACETYMYLMLFRYMHNRDLKNLSSNQEVSIYMYMVYTCTNTCEYNGLSHPCTHSDLMSSPNWHAACLYMHVHVYTAHLDPGINECYRVEVSCGECRRWQRTGLDGGRRGLGRSTTTSTASRRGGGGHGLIPYAVCGPGDIQYRSDKRYNAFTFSLSTKRV